MKNLARVRSTPVIIESESGAGKPALRFLAYALLFLAGFSRPIIEDYFGAHLFSSHGVEGFKHHNLCAAFQDRAALGQPDRLIQ